MRLNAVSGLSFDVSARLEPAGTVGLQLRIGPLQFTLGEVEAIALANRLVDTVETYRRKSGRWPTTQNGALLPPSSPTPNVHRSTTR